MRNSTRVYVVGLAAVLAFSGLIANYGQTGPAATAPTRAPALMQWQMARLQYANDVLEAARRRLQAGMGTVAEVSAAMRLVVESQFDMVETKTQRLAVAQQQMAVCEELLNDVENWVKAGRLAASELSFARYDLAEAKVRLLKIQAEP